MAFAPFQRAVAPRAPSVWQFAPQRALRAARALAANPDDLPQVFAIIEALSGTTLARIARRLGASESGRRILQERPDVVALLADRQALGRLPEGSLGRAYLAFVERENISAAGIRAANESASHAAPLPAPLDYLHARLRDTHDLWHALVGYHGDVLGETALLAFTLAQTWNPAVALIVGIGLWKTSGSPEARRVILDGFRRGRKAAWLPALEWETLLAEPVAALRARLALEAPPVYAVLRTSALRARGVLA